MPILLHCSNVSIIHNNVCYLVTFCPDHWQLDIMASSVWDSGCVRSHVPGVSCCHSPDPDWYSLDLMISWSLQTLCIPRRCLCLLSVSLSGFWCSKLFIKHYCLWRNRNACGLCCLRPRNKWLLLVVLEHWVLHMLWRGEMLRRRVEPILLWQGDGLRQFNLMDWHWG